MYQNISELPQSVQRLPYEAKRIFLKTFNSSIKYYRNEQTAFRIAWSSVKRKYYKSNSGLWISYSNANDYDTTSTDDNYDDEDNITDDTD